MDQGPPARGLPWLPHPTPCCLLGLGAVPLVLCWGWCREPQEIEEGLSQGCAAGPCQPQSCSYCWCPLSAPRRPFPRAAAGRGCEGVARRTPLIGPYSEVWPARESVGPQGWEGAGGAMARPQGAWLASREAAIGAALGLLPPGLHVIGLAR